MKSVPLPAIWLVVLIVGLPQLSETIYTPSLPDIARALQTSESVAEYTITIYLVGFALGTLFWGKCSDKFGRKPCILMGLIIFICGCIGCYTASNIEILMVSRLIQAFGGSIGSVLGQAICRDAFHGPALGKAYSSIGSSLALFPAIGPVIGGIIATNLSWYTIFLFLIAFALILSFLIIMKLPETYHAAGRIPISTSEVALDLLKNRRVIGLGIIIAACNGIAFSYFAEGPFYLIKALGLTVNQYSFSFTAIAMATMMGGIFSKKIHLYRASAKQLYINHSSEVIMNYGLIIILIASALFSAITIAYYSSKVISTWLIITVAIISQMSIMFGICMATSNALALALIDYKHCIGTASSLFGFFYYCLISLFTLGMGYIHNGTLLPMPLYFFALSVFMIIVQKISLDK